MRVQNTGKLAEVLAECGWDMPPDFEIPDARYQVHLEEVRTQQTHVDEVHQEAIAIIRTLGEHMKAAAGGAAGDAHQVITDDTIRRTLSVAEYWGRYGHEQAELMRLERQILTDQGAKMIAAGEAMQECFASVVRHMNALYRAADANANERSEKMRKAVQSHVRAGWFTFAAIALLLLILILTVTAHAQEPGIKLDVQQGGVSQQFTAAGVATLNCDGTTVTCTPNAGTGAVDIAATGGPGGGYNRVQNNGSNLTQRTIVNCLARLACADDGVSKTTLDLATTGVGAGTYTKLTIDIYGRVTSATSAAFSDLSGSATCAQLPALTGDVTSSGCATSYANSISIALGGTGQTTYTKGDMLTHPGGAATNKLAAGRDRYVFTADAASTNGVKWQSPIRPLYRVQRCLACATGNNRVTVNDTEVLTAGSITSVAAVAGVGPMSLYATTTTVNTTANDNDNAIYYRSESPEIQNILKFPAATDYASTRVFWGLSDQTAATMLGADVPAGNYLGIYASTTGSYTSLTDTTNFVCTQKDGTTQNAVTTGVAFGSTTKHTFDAYANEQSGAIEYYIDGVQVCGSMTSNRPTSTTAMRQIMGIQNLTAGTLRSVQSAFVWIEHDPF